MASPKPRFKRFATQLVHSGEPRPRLRGAVAMPIFQSSTFETGHGGEDYHDIKYMRLSNLPNHDVLHEKLATLENAEAAVVTSSGMAAIATALLTVLRSGDHVIFQDCLYGGTHNFVTEDLPAHGVAFDFFHGDEPAAWRELLRPNTRAVYVEAMTNPLLEVTDLEAVARFAQEHDLVSMIDNTAASPMLFRPAEWGFDLSLHSCTKYLNGHTDIVGGAVIGREPLVRKIWHKLNHLGGSLDAHACFLLQRGMKTLALRLAQQQKTAQRLAELLAEHAAVERVHYPGLAGDPSHERATRFFDGYGGLLSFRVKEGRQAAMAVMDRLQIPAPAPSFGGVESLITRPAATSHVGMAAEARERLGITEDLLRVAVGIEDSEDLLEDFRQALG